MPPLSKKAELRFRYYSGLTGTVQATSDPFTVFTNGQAVIDCKFLVYLLRLFTIFWLRAK